MTETRPKVAMVDHVIPEYRRQFLVRLSELTDIDATCFHGQERVGYTARATKNPIPYPIVTIKNIYWLLFGARIIWSTAFLKVMRGKFNIVVVGEVVHNFLVWAFWLLNKTSGPALIISGHCLFPDQPRSLFTKIRNFLRKMLHQRCDAIMAYTDEGKSDLIRIGINPEKIFVCSNTLDTKKIIEISEKVPQNEIDELKTKYEISDQPTLIFVGRLYAGKRVDILIEAIRLLQKSNIYPKVFIIGDGHLRKTLEDQARDLSNIIFVGEIYEDSKIAKFFKISDLMIMPDMIGLGIVHAFCFGVPVMTLENTSNHGPEVQYIQNNSNGVFVDQLDAESFAAAIANTLSNRNRLDKMKKAALKTAGSLSIENMVKEYERAIYFVSDSNVPTHNE